MRTKNILTTMALVMTMSMIVGCGKETTEVTSDVPAVESSTQETTETTDAASEETSITLGYVKPDATSELTSQETEEFTGLTEDYAIEKLIKVHEAYDTLMSQNKTLEYCTQWCLENLSVGYVFEGLKTADGQDLTENPYAFDSYMSIIQNYYYDYINNNGDYFDFYEYVTTHNYDDIIITDVAEYYDKTERIVCDNLGMYYTLTSISDGKEVTIANITDDIDETISMASKDGMKNVAYKCDILIDGEASGFTMLFDSEGNFLNFKTTDAADDLFVTSFPNGL